MSGDYDGRALDKVATRRRICSDRLKVRPMERAASACPVGTALMPERTASQKDAA